MDNKESNNSLSVHFLVTNNNDGKNFSTATLALHKFIENNPSTPTNYEKYVNEEMDEYEICDSILKADPSQIQKLIHDIDYFIIQRLNTDENFRNKVFQTSRVVTPEENECIDLFEEINYLLLTNKILNKNNPVRVATESKITNKLLPVATQSFQIFIIKNYKCPFCIKAIQLLKEQKALYNVIEVENIDYLIKNIDPLTKPQMIRSFPIIFLNNVYIGSLVQLKKYFEVKENTISINNSERGLI